MEPFIGQISAVAFPFAPRGWALCSGQILPIAQNQALFSILGTTYGGNGVNTFALPDLRGRAAVHTGPVNALGAQAGTENVTLNSTQMPLHTHAVVNAVTTTADASDPTGALWAATTSAEGNLYNPTPDVLMAPNALAMGGGNQPHNNMHPTTVVNFIIALQGIFPSRN